MTFKKLGKNQERLKSGVILSKANQARYWECSVSGILTFASKERWPSIMERFKSEENLVKTFVCREAKKYLGAGYTEVEIRKMVADNKGNLPKFNTLAENKPLVDVRVPKKEKKVRVKPVKVEKVIENNVEVKKAIYAWSADPQNYFKGGEQPIDVAADTKDTCLFPNRYLDDECRNCPVYELCTCALKFTAEDWEAGRKKAKKEIVLKPIASFTDEEIAEALGTEAVVNDAS
jgi:hypothetical protein